MKKSTIVALLVSVLMVSGLSFAFKNNSDHFNGFSKPFFTAIAKVEKADVKPMFDIEILKQRLLLEEFFAEIDHIEITSELNPESNKYESHLIITGKNPVDFGMMAYQAELVEKKGVLYLGNPTIHDELYLRHYCNSVKDTNCEFGRNDNKSIFGCKNSCNHSLETGNVTDQTTKGNRYFFNEIYGMIKNLSVY